MGTMQGRPVLMERYPNGASRQVVLPEAGAEGHPRLAADRDGRDAERHDQRGARGRRHRPRRVGGEHRLPRLPRVALPGGRPRAHRRAAHRPRPVARRRLRPGAGDRPPQVRGAVRRAGHPLVREDVGLAGPPHLRAPAAAVGLVPGAGGGGRRSPASSSGATPTSSPPSGGRRSAGTRVFVDFNQNAPHKTVFGAWCARPRTGAQVSTPIEWDERRRGHHRRAHHRHRARPGSPSGATRGPT